MYIKQLESRNKKTLFLLKQIKFEQINCLACEDISDGVYILNTLESLANFALGNHGDFTDNICRLSFHAAHKEYMWFNKTDAKENFYIDEEEFYKGDEMLMRRAESELTIYEYDNLPPINPAQSIFHILDTEDIRICRKAFENVYRYNVTQITDDLIASIGNLPHGALVLLDASAAESPLELQPLLVREDVQLISVGFTYEQMRNVVKKSNALSIK